MANPLMDENTYLFEITFSDKEKRGPGPAITDFVSRWKWY
jgi:hypothetical protein